jgi:hypothetical protein
MDRFQGGRQWLMAGGGLGLVLTLATFGGVAMDPVAGWASYLVAFAYWSAIAMASVIMLQIFHATRAKWMIVLKRPVEIMGSTVPLFILLFIPIAFFGLKTLYSWVEPASTLSRETLHLLHNKRPWLNPGFFIGRGSSAGRRSRTSRAISPSRRSSATWARAACRSSAWRSPSRPSTG